MATAVAPRPINVPANLRWSKALAETASENHYYLYVGGTKVGHRTLSGAERTWKKPGQGENIFITAARVTGSPQDVAETLSYAGFSQAEINALFAEAINKDNYQSSKKAEYDAEVAAYKAIADKKTAAPTYAFSSLGWFADNLGAAKVSSKAGEKKGAAAAGKGRRGESLAEKLKGLAAGKVLDVSAMDLATGSGVRTINTPKPTGRSGKAGSVAIPIVSNDLARYIKALELAYGAGAQQQYAADIDLVRRMLTARAAPAAPVATPGARAPSPLRVPGQALAAPPRLVPAVASPPRTIAGPAQTIPTLATLARK